MKHVAIEANKSAVVILLRLLLPNMLVSVETLQVFHSVVHYLPSVVYCVVIYHGI